MSLLSDIISEFYGRMFLINFEIKFKIVTVISFDINLVVVVS